MGGLETIHGLLNRLTVCYKSCFHTMHSGFDNPTVTPCSSQPYSASESTWSEHRFSSSYPNHVLGVVLLDLNGLPKHCFTLDTSSAKWVQATFSALCLKSLLGCCLQIKGFNHLIIRGSECNILLIRQTERYIGLLIRCNAPEAIVELILKQTQSFQFSEF